MLGGFIVFRFGGRGGDTEVIRELRRVPVQRQVVPIVPERVLKLHRDLVGLRKTTRNSKLAYTSAYKTRRLVCRLDFLYELVCRLDVLGFHAGFREDLVD